MGIARCRRSPDSAGSACCVLHDPHCRAAMLSGHGAWHAECSSGTCRSCAPHAHRRGTHGSRCSDHLGARRRLRGIRPVGPRRSRGAMAPWSVDVREGAISRSASGGLFPRSAAGHAHDDRVQRIGPARRTTRRGDGGTRPSKHRAAFRARNPKTPMSAVRDDAEAAQRPPNWMTRPPPTMSAPPTRRLGEGRSPKRAMLNTWLTTKNTAM
jgi:hypothetical protein